MIFSPIFIIIFKCALFNVEADESPICKTVDNPKRRSNINDNLPYHEPYLPNVRNSIFYNCSKLECNTVKVHSLTQVASPLPTLKYCYLETTEKYKCEPLKYYHFKNIDKLLFLNNNIPHKSFYLIDCLAYADGGRLCVRKDEVDSHTKLVDIGNVMRPNETNVLSQEEFLCEESKFKMINCDRDLYVPYQDGLRDKERIKLDDKILVKIDYEVITLNHNCIDTWCGYSGQIRSTRRYQPSGGKIFRCFYANRQQVCKEIESSYYNERDWLIR
ncbi:seminal fluid protein HACP030 [Danaus plexippus plexippus]|uniref:Seminal fluid protein HACP030 n=1 Tax=Danaus plexippus plexippus TaxID=278856 RepID=A0A212EST6_DANPL|nr:seminal fluid protein HACP030 [Danaus plexippus plexippus]